MFFFLEIIFTSLSITFRDFNDFKHGLYNITLIHYQSSIFPYATLTFKSFIINILSDNGENTLTHLSIHFLNRIRLQLYSMIRYNRIRFLQNFKSFLIITEGIRCLCCICERCPRTPIQCCYIFVLTLCDQ